MAQLTKPVGKDVNTPPHDRDVLLVQQLLNKHRAPTTAPLAEDGTMGPKTIAAIEDFQRRVVRMARPDGRVDPNGATIRALLGPGNLTTAKPFGWDLPKAISHLKTHAKKSKPYGQCAAYVREAIEAGNLRLNRTNSAKDYGPSLVMAGFKLVNAASYAAGDVVIMQGFVRQIAGKCSDPKHGDKPHEHKHLDGHMQMFGGTAWISDFVQSDFWPGEDFRIVRPSFSVYRFSLLGDFNVSNSATRVV